MKREVDVAIIGAGSGGLSARREVEKKTKNYVVIDGGTLGTTCARVGCMPSKVLIQVAEDFYRRNKHLEEGIHGGDNLTVNTKEVMAHVRKLRDRFVRGVLGGMNSWGQEHFIDEYAKFVDANTLKTKSFEITAKKIILASGSSPAIPDIFKGYESFLITTDSFFELEDLPKSMAVIGLGVIGMELGQAVSRLGVNTIGIGRRKNVCGITDPKLNDYATQKFSELLNLSFAGVEKVEQKKNQLAITTDGKTHYVDKVLVTSGRGAQWQNLNIEALGYDLNNKIIPEFDSETRALTKYPHIFIAGDNSGEKQILHEASDEGRVAGYNAVNEVKAFRPRTPLMVTFSDPNIACSGASYKELTDKGIDFEIGEVSFEGQGRSIVKLKEIGMLRVYGDKKSKRILGSELMAPDGEHLAHLLSWVISQEMNVNEVLNLPFYHPVIEEGLRTALRDLRDKIGGNEDWPLEIKMRL